MGKRWSFKGKEDEIFEAKRKSPLHGG